MKKKRVIVAVSNDLVADRRVDKECTTLHNHGYDVLLMGCYKKGRPELDSLSCILISENHFAGLMTSAEGTP